jgi:hypothetical protein
MNRIVQVLGSVRIFTPFIAAQRGSVTTASNADLTRNFVGASVLTVLVGHERQYCGQSRRRMNCCGPLDRPRRGSFSTIWYLADPAGAKPLGASPCALRMPCRDKRVDGAAEASA